MWQFSGTSPPRLQVPTHTKGCHKGTQQIGPLLLLLLLLLLLPLLVLGVRIFIFLPFHSLEYRNHAQHDQHDRQDDDDQGAWERAWDGSSAIKPSLPACDPT